VISKGILSNAILYAFVMFEVLLYNSQGLLQFVLSIFCYLTLFILSNINLKVSVLYYISFSLLSFGEWSYVITDMPNNFYGIRIGGISLNVIFLFYLVIRIMTDRSNKLNKDFVFKHSIFFFVFLYCFVLGLLNVSLGVNFVDNFLANVMVYLPLLFQLILVSILGYEDLQILLKKVIGVSIFGMILSFILNVRFEYSEGYDYLLISGVSFILPFSIYLFRGYFNKNVYYLLVLIIIYFLFSGNIFINGKLFVILGVLTIWLFKIEMKKIKRIIMIPLLIIFISPFLIQKIKNDPIMSYKFNQISAVFNGEGNIKSSDGSLANIFGEFYCIYEHMKNNPDYLVFGKGFGGGVPDQNNLLGQYAGESGYKEIDRIRNDFTTMHISLSELLLKFGLFGVFIFLTLLLKLFLSRSREDFILFILLFTVFYTSKEMCLLTVVFIAIRYHKNLIHA